MVRVVKASQPGELAGKALERLGVGDYAGAVKKFVKAGLEGIPDAGERNQLRMQAGNAAIAAAQAKIRGRRPLRLLSAKSHLGLGEKFFQSILLDEEAETKYKVQAVYGQVRAKLVTASTETEFGEVLELLTGSNGTRGRVPLVKLAVYQHNLVGIKTRSEGDEPALCEDPDIQSTYHGMLETYQHVKEMMGPDKSRETFELTEAAYTQTLKQLLGEKSTRINGKELMSATKTILENDSLRDQLIAQVKKIHQPELLNNIAVALSTRIRLGLRGEHMQARMNELWIPERLLKLTTENLSEQSGDPAGASETQGGGQRLLEATTHNLDLLRETQLWFEDIPPSDLETVKRYLNHYIFRKDTAGFSPQRNCD